MMHIPKYSGKRALCKVGSGGGVRKMDKNTPIGQRINKIGQACETRVAVSQSATCEVLNCNDISSTESQSHGEVQQFLDQHK